MKQCCSLWTYKLTFLMQHGEKSMKHSWAFILGCIRHTIRSFKRRNSSVLISVLLSLGLVKNPITPTSGPFLPHWRPFAPAVVCPNCDTKAGKAALNIRTDGYLIVCTVYFKSVGSTHYAGMCISLQAHTFNRSQLTGK